MVTFACAQGSLYVQDGVEGIMRCVYDASKHEGHGAIDPQVSPDGLWVAFVKNSEIFVSPIVGDERPPVQLTHGADPPRKTHGLADFIAQEEMDRYTGFWWGPDSRSIAFTEVDEGHIPAFVITHSVRLLLRGACVLMLPTVGARPCTAAHVPT
jgi:dipeptidyl-peptidase 4